MDKKTRKSLADALRGLATKIDDEDVDVIDARMDSRADVTEGMAPGGAWSEYRRNGRFTYDLHLDLYVPKSDEAQEDGTWWKADPSIIEVMGRVPWTD